MTDHANCVARQSVSGQRSRGPSLTAWLLDAGVVLRETYDFGDTRMHPAELEIVRHAQAARQAEFAAVRACARGALRVLGRECGPLLPGLRGAPVWPAGTVGSMTHCDGYAAAIAAEESRYRGLGLDAERDNECPARVLERICGPAELATILSPRHGEPHWGTLVFSAKEAAYKLMWTVFGADVRFQQFHVIAEPDCTLRVNVRGEPNWPGVLHGRWAHSSGIITTVTLLEAQPPMESTHREDLSGMLA